MSILMKAVGMIVPLLVGCYVVQDETPRQYSPPQQDERSFPGELDVVVSPEAEEINYVVYREYFGCTEQEISYFPHYRLYYGLTDDDIYFITFTARQCNVSFDVCFHSYYYDCDRNYDRLVVYYHVPRERYFVAIGTGVSPPLMYARTYGSYRSGVAGMTFTNQEYVALVHMKVGVDYQGQPPATFFARVQSTGSSRRVIVDSRDLSGRGGRTVTGAKITATAPHPWTMPAPQKQQWHQERQASTAKTEGTFKASHKEQVTKVENQKPAQREVEHRSAPGSSPPQAQGRPDPSDSKRPHEPELQAPVDRPHAQEPQRPADRPHPPEPKVPADRPSGRQVPERQPQKKAEKPPPKPPQHEEREKPKGVKDDHDTRER
jgi:hypothetical protein